MLLTSDLCRRRVSRPSRPVPTSVPTSSQAGQWCPDRPDLFRVRTYRLGVLTILKINNRSGQLGQLGQINSRNGFGRPDLCERSGHVGTAGFIGVPRESRRGARDGGRHRIRSCSGVQVRGSSLEGVATGNSDPDKTLVTGVFKGGYVDA